MGATNYAHYSKEQIEMACLFKSLGHPARIAVVELHAQDLNLSQREVLTHIPLSQSSISKHCKHLFENGFLGLAFESRKTVYILSGALITLIAKYFRLIGKAKVRDEGFRFIRREIVPEIRYYGDT